VGPHGALELGLLGETISAEEAVRIGLDNRSVPADAWRSTVDDMALRLASGFNRIP
jgi:enoyl-CoA hydratase/carnithine racemase